MLRFGPFQLDPLQGLRQGDREIRITPKSLSLLCLLVERAGMTVSKDEIFRRIWPDTNVSDAALSSCIQELRSALNEDGKSPKFIETQHRRGYRFIFNSGVTSVPVPEAAFPAHRATLVGRERQIEHLQAAWQTAIEGRRQVVLVSGHAGVGKSALVSQFVSETAKTQNALATWGQCVQHFGAGEPYEPILDALNRLCRQPNGDRFVPMIQRHGPTWLGQLPSLLPPETFLALQQAIAGTTRERMFRELTETLEALSAEESVVLWLEDLHWSDRSTLEWIGAFAQRPDRARLLLIGTFRTSEVAGTDHPLSHLPHELQLRGLCRHLFLGGLDQSATGDYIQKRYPQWHDKKATDRLAGVVHARTEGNPLFVINVLNSLEERGLIQRIGETWTLSTPIDYEDLEIPNDLRRSIDALIERLPEEERRLLEIASVAGTEFSSAMVAAIASISTSDVEERLASLARRERVIGFAERRSSPTGPDYRFLHVLYSDAFYRRVTSGRLQQLHLQVGKFKEALFENSAQDRPSELAMHFELAKEFDAAIRYFDLAGASARKKSAYSEARMHFDRAIALLPHLPEGQGRAKREVALYADLGGVLMASYGFGAKEAEAAFAYSRKLSRELEQSPEVFRARWGLWLFYWGRGALKAADEIAHEMVASAGKAFDTGMLLQAHHAAWATSYSRGELQSTLHHTSEGLRLYEASKHAAMASTYGDHDAGVCCLNFRARALVICGRSSDAVRTCASAIRLATDLSQPLSLATAYVFAASVHQMRRDPDAALKNAEAAIRVAEEQGLRLMRAWADVFAGWAHAHLGRREYGLNQVERGIQSVTQMGTEQSLTHLLAMKADIHLLMDRNEEGRQAIDQAIGVMNRTEERYYESEIYRLAGALAAKGQREEWLQKAVETARSRGSALFQLRAMIDLAKGRHQPLGPGSDEWLAETGLSDWAQLPPADQADLQDLNVDVHSATPCDSA